MYDVPPCTCWYARTSRYRVGQVFQWFPGGSPGTIQKPGPPCTCRGVSRSARGGDHGKVSSPGGVGYSSKSEFPKEAVVSWKPLPLWETHFQAPETQMAGGHLSFWRQVAGSCPALNPMVT